MKHILPAVIFFVAAHSFCSGASIDIDEFIENASIRYEKRFTVDMPPDLWNRILDNPVLMGKLWEAYEFPPRYKLNKKGSGVHIIDPTGIEGDLYEIFSGKYKRIFYCSGKMKNWYIPISLRGKALFLFKQTYAKDSVNVTMNIYGEGGKTLMMKILLKALSPVLTLCIHKRVTRNLRDLKIIAKDMVDNPGKIRLMISGVYLRDFNRILNTES